MSRLVEAASSIASFANPSDLASLQTLSETTVVNGRPYTAVFDRPSLTSTATSPEGRTSVATFDEQGRPTRMDRGGLAPTTMSYDERGRLDEIVTGEGANARRFQFGYDTSALFHSVSVGFLVPVARGTGTKRAISAAGIGVNMLFVTELGARYFF